MTLGVNNKSASNRISVNNVNNQLGDYSINYAKVKKQAAAAKKELVDKEEVR